MKSEDSPIGREPVDKLLGVVTKFNADQGLFVAWGGFKGNVQKELAAQFFRLRLWTQKDLLEQLFEQYERLDEDLKAELPLKRVGWLPHRTARAENHGVGATLGATKNRPPSESLIHKA